MERTRNILFCFAIVIIVVAETNAAGNGCSWSGCQHFTSSTCGTDLTGGSGRHFFVKSKSCQVIGRKDFCCDGDCGWRAYGTTCEQLNQNSYTDEVGSANSAQQFCCPSSARPNNGFKTNDSGVATFREGSGNRTANESGGSRTANESGGFRTANENGGFRTANESDGFRTTNEDGCATPANQDGGATLANQDDGVRASNEGGGFRSG